jgi:hypothetical protein
MAFLDPRYFGAGEACAGVDSAIVAGPRARREPRALDMSLTLKECGHPLLSLIDAIS